MLFGITVVCLLRKACAWREIYITADICWFTQESCWVGLSRYVKIVKIVKSYVVGCDWLDSFLSCFCCPWLLFTRIGRNCIDFPVLKSWKAKFEFQLRPGRLASALHILCSRPFLLAELMHDLFFLLNWCPLQKWHWVRCIDGILLSDFSFLRVSHCIGEDFYLQVQRPILFDMFCLLLATPSATFGQRLARPVTDMKRQLGRILVISLRVSN